MESEDLLAMKPEDAAQKLLSAVHRDIEPLLLSTNYPRRNLLGPAFSESMLFGLGRERYLSRYGHVLLSRECADALVELLKGHRVLDVCAGGGFLAHTLANAGVEVMAADLYPPGLAPTERDSRVRWKVDFAGSSLELPLEEYSALVMAWPDHQDPFADQIAASMRPGQLLVYQGEGAGGATADDAFFARVSGPGWEFLRAETEALNRHHVRFHGMNDYWCVLKRVANEG